MKTFFIFSLLFGFYSLAGIGAAAAPAQILLIRHAEKPESGPELSPEGWARARALPQLFLKRPEFMHHGKPVALYAMAPKKEGGSVRAIETLKYVSQNFGLDIISEYTRDDYKDMIDEIFKNSQYDGKLVVICWEHKVLGQIADDLGVDSQPNYPDDKFDRAWLISFSGKDFKKFEDLPQRLLAGDDRN